MIGLTNTISTNPEQIDQADNLNLIEMQVRNFYKALLANDYIKIMQNIGQIEKFSKQIYEKNNFTKEIFSNISEYLYIESEILIVEGSTQSKQSFSLKSYLDVIEKHNYHSIEVKNRYYCCDYHLESLFCHLVLAMLNMLSHLQNSVNDPKKIVQLALLALVHDIGKPACLNIVNTGRSSFTKFAMHGEMGCGLLLELYSDKQTKFFTKSEYEDWCRTVSVHMCGYHETNPNSYAATYKWPLLSLENPNTQEMLGFLSVADKFGAIRQIELRLDYELFLKSREDFSNQIKQPFDTINFLKFQNLTGMCIFVCGTNYSGKTTLAKKILEIAMLQNIKTTIININDQSDKIYVSKIIDTALTNNELVIIDSVYTYYKSIDFFTPKSMFTTFKIGIDVIRTNLFVENNSTSIQEQLELFEDKSMMSWLPKSVLGACSPVSDSRLSYLTPITTAMHIDSAKEKRTRPHLRFVLTWNLGFATLNIALEKVFQTWTNKTLLLDSNESNGSNESNNSNGSNDSNESNNIIELEPSLELGLKLGSETDSMNITKLIHHLYQLNNNVEPFSKFAGDWFFERGFLAKPPPQFKDSVFKDSIIKIKYIENCRLWKPKWARQCRGIVLVKYSPSADFICIKSLLQRGAEVLTGMHLKTGINSTQDGSNTIFDHFDLIQQETIQKFLKSEPIRGYSSFKKDGSLLGISLYKNNSQHYYEIDNIINTYGDAFSLEVKKLVQKMNLDFLPVFSSQDTYFLSNMQAYTLTSIICGYIGMPYTELQKLAINTPDKLIYLIEPFLQSLQTYYTNLIPELKTDIMSLSFETICANRTSAWGDAHPELAIQYQHSSIVFLGMSIVVNNDNDTVYFPHVQLEQYFANTKWDQPLYWEINHTIKMENMICDLELVINGKSTELDFLTQYQVSNKVKSHNNVIDYEGFIFYRDTGSVYHNLPILDYSKIKTNTYYKTHKFREENIPDLMKLPSSVDAIFPLVKTVKIFFSSLYDKLNKIMIKVDSELKTNSELVNGLTEKIKSAYYKQKTDVQAKMIIANAQNWKPIPHKFFVEEFCNLPDEDEIHHTIKNIIMTIKPWESNYTKTIEVMIEKSDPNLRKLFGYMLVAI